jgi:hypothetical protein
MDQTVREHIDRLTIRVQALNEQLMEQGQGVADQNRIESEIRAAQLALDYYRKAIELEKNIG